MKQRYGTQGCYLLKINSRGSNRGADEQIPDPWSQYLHKNSIQNLVCLILLFKICIAATIFLSYTQGLLYCCLFANVSDKLFVHGATIPFLLFC